MLLKFACTVYTLITVHSLLEEMVHSNPTVEAKFYENFVITSLILQWSAFISIERRHHFYIQQAFSNYNCLQLK